MLPPATQAGRIAAMVGRHERLPPHVHRNVRPRPKKPVLGQNAIVVHSLAKQAAKDRSLGPWSVPQYLVRDVIGLVEPLRRQVLALPEAVCSLPDKGTTGPTCIAYAARRS